MKVNTRLRYGLRALMMIICKEGVMQKEITETEGITEKYLDHLITDMRKGGIIRNIEDKKRCGYELTRPASEINMLDVFNAFNLGEMNIPCVSDDINCENEPKCKVKNFWGDLNDHMREYLRNISLEDMQNKYFKK